MKTSIVRFAAATLVAVLMLGVGTSQVLAHSPSHAAKAKRKHKKSSALVHCASVTVKCHTHQGAQGPVGIAGPSGAPGAAGHGIVARIRSTGAVATKPSGGTAVALAPSSFEQAAGLDEELLGAVTITSPSGECESGKAHFGTAVGLVAMDGELVGKFELGGSYSFGSVRTIPILWLSGLPEPSSATLTLPPSVSAEHHALVVEVSDDCEVAGATHFTVDSVAIDVLRAG